jgi:hypothetical protein
MMGREVMKIGQSIGDWFKETYRKTMKTLGRIENDIRDSFERK